jgi:hypothetical protein
VNFKLFRTKDPVVGFGDRAIKDVLVSANTGPAVLLMFDLERFKFDVIVIGF